MIKVLLFAHLRELAGCSEVLVDPNAVHTIRELVTSLGQTHPLLLEALADESALISVNHRYAGWDAIVGAGDEVGILPPVSGG